MCALSCTQVLSLFEKTRQAFIEHLVHAGRGSDDTDPTLPVGFGARQPMGGSTRWRVKQKDLVPPSTHYQNRCPASPVPQQTPAVSGKKKQLVLTGWAEGFCRGTNLAVVVDSGGESLKEPVLTEATSLPRMSCHLRWWLPWASTPCA